MIREVGKPLPVRVPVIVVSMILADGLYEDKTIQYQGRAKFEYSNSYINFNNSELIINSLHGSSRSKLFLLGSLNDNS